MTTYQDQYRAAKADGYSDQEIMSYLEENDPDFASKMNSAIEDGYTPQEVLSYFNSPPKQKQEKEFGFGDYAEDFGKQAGQGIGIGALGTYGDILDLFGLQSKEILPGEKAKYSREFDILEKMDRGEVPSAGEFMELSGDDEIAPRFSRLPSSQDVESLGKDLGLVSDPKTWTGRYGRRIGKLGGSGLAVGATSIAAPIIAGAAGQTLEELGAPAWAQAAAEIIATLKTGPKTKVPVTAKSPEVQNVVNGLRKAGYAEQDITLAMNALQDRKILGVLPAKKVASLSPKAENLIQEGIKNSEQLFKEQIKKGLPGYAEGGLPYLEKQASNVYQSMEELASSVPIKNTEPVRKAIQDSIDYLEKYPLLDEQKKFIEFMKDGLSKLGGAQNVGKLATPEKAGLTAEFLTGFYRNLGKAGNWGDPKQKEYLLGLVKQGIKNTFSESGPEAAKFGKYFEATNDAWKQWLSARDLMQTIEKAQHVDGMNFKKLSSLLNDPKNHNLANKVLGPQQLENIKVISEGAQTIESLLKQLPKSERSTQEMKFLASLGALFFHGNAAPLSALIGWEATKRYATNFLTDPKKQNKFKKIINAAKNKSPSQVRILAGELAEESSFEPNQDGSSENKR